MLCLALLLNPVVDVDLFPKKKPQLNMTTRLAPLIEYEQANRVFDNSVIPVHSKVQFVHCTDYSREW